MATCPCNRRKVGSLIISCSQNCEFGSWHTECAGFLNVVNKKQVEDIGEWNCPSCALRALKIPGHIANEHSCMSRIDEQLENLKSEINDLKDIKQEFAEVMKQNEKAKTLWSDIVKSGVPEQVKSNVQEAAVFATKIANKVVQKSNEVMHERDSREKNIIMLNVVESTQTNSNEKQKDDQDFFGHLCEQIKLQPISTSKIVRIGRERVSPPNADDETPKPRPVKICFNSVFDKRKFMSNLYHLKQAADPFKSVHVNHDLTVDDRNLTKQLLKEAYDKNQSEKPTDFLYKVRGPPGAIKIVKVYHRL